MMKSASLRGSKSAARLVVFLAGALTAIALVDSAANLTSPKRFRREIEDAIVDLRASDPDILVISSSHGRSFHVLGQELAKRTHGQATLVAFPLEAGKMRAMEWVLRNRAVPILDERDSSGNRKRTRLRQLLFGITWWDSCRRWGAPPVDPNVVSRAWTLTDYLQDVAAHGVNESNRNFIRYKLQRALRFSRLVQSLGNDPLQKVADRITAISASMSAPRLHEFRTPFVPQALAKWREDIETGQSCLYSPSELEALERMEAFARERKLDFTVVLFPLMPQTITPIGQKTLDRFAELTRRRGHDLGYRVVDMTRLPVLTDDDFMSDMDHVSEVGNAKYTEWALQHELGFLLDTVPLRPRAASGQGAP